MPKFVFNPNVKIVKSCIEKPLPPSRVDEAQVVCPEIAILADENFLANVDEEIFYVNGSIEIKAPDSVNPKRNEENIERNLVRNEEENETVERVASVDEFPSSYESSTSSLSEQISLPLKVSESLFFYEVLMISQETSNVRSNQLVPKHDEIDDIGNACIMAEKIDDGNAMVYITVQMLEGDKNVTQEILSVVNLNLQLVHEKTIERSCVNGRFMEKSLLILADDDGGFRLIKTETTDNETEKWMTDIKWTEPGDFISCGANVLLTRRLVLDGFEGCVNCWTCDMAGNFLLSRQTFLKPELTSVLDQLTQVQRVNRLLITKNGQVTKISSFFHSPTSCLIKEISSTKPCAIHLNPLSEFPTKTAFKDLHVSWDADLQLMSKFLDCKEKRKAELKQQFDHPRMKMIFRDFILCLIKSKPTNIMSFTMDFLRKMEREANVHQVYQTANRRHQQNSG